MYPYIPSGLYTEMVSNQAKMSTVQSSHWQSQSQPQCTPAPAAASPSHIHKTVYKSIGKRSCFGMNARDVFFFPLSNQCFLLFTVQHKWITGRNTSSRGIRWTMIEQWIVCLPFFNLNFENKSPFCLLFWQFLAFYSLFHLIVRLVNDKYTIESWIYWPGIRLSSKWTQSGTRQHFAYASLVNACVFTKSVPPYIEPPSHDAKFPLAGAVWNFTTSMNNLSLYSGDANSVSSSRFRRANKPITIDVPPMVNMFSANGRRMSIGHFRIASRMMCGNDWQSLSSGNSTSNALSRKRPGMVMESLPLIG